VRDDPDCPCLLRETVSRRESLDLSKDAPMRVTEIWYCAHPFHGLRLSLGDDPAAVRRHCAACTLPRSGSRGPAAEAEGARRRDDVVGGDTLEACGDGSA
jgi:hypothetical protein